MDTDPRILAAETRDVRVADLHEHPDNPRTGNVANLLDSVRANGFYTTLTVQRSSMRVLCGNHRLRAARDLGMTHVPCRIVDVTDEHARRLLLVDNRSNDLASYDNDALLAVLMQFDENGLIGTGYTADDIADLARMVEPRNMDDAFDDRESGEDEDFHGTGTVRIYVAQKLVTTIGTSASDTVPLAEVRAALDVVFAAHPEWGASLSPVRAE